MQYRDTNPPPSAALFFMTVVAAAILSHWMEPFHPPLWTAWVTVLVTAMGIVAARPGHRFRRHAIICAVSLVAIHTTLIAADYQRPGEHGVASWIGEDKVSAELTLAVTSGPIVHERGVSFDAHLLSIDIDDEQQLTTPAPLVRVFYSTDGVDPCSPLPLPGDRVTTWAELERFAPASVPWRLSHRRLMEGRGYSAQVGTREQLQFDDRQNLSARLRLHRRLAAHRIGLERRVNQFVDGDGQAMALAMLTGSRGELSPELREPFNITSTGHILAISGLHFGVIAALIAFVVRLVLDRFPRLYRRWPRRMVIGLLTLVFLWLYLLAIGAPVSARRAYGMTALAIAVFSFSPWRLRPLSALAVTAGVLLLIRPSLILEAGYQLSITATAGILLFLRYRPRALHPPDIPGPETEPRHKRWVRRFMTFVGFSVSATLATWPVLWKMTGEIPVAGLWANLVVVPVVGSVLFPLLVAGALLTSLWPAAADVVLTLSTQGLMVLYEMVDWLAYTPGSTIRPGTPSTVEWIGAFLAVAICLVGGLRLRALAAGAAVAVLCSTPGFLETRFSPPTTMIHFIDVGQGDATLIEASDGTTMLIDGAGRPVGADPGLRYVVPYLRHRGIDRLDVVVLTHGDYDHYGGLFATIRPFSPRLFVVDSDEDNDNVVQLIRQMNDAGAQIEYVDRRLDVATDDVAFQILKPQIFGANDNDRSLVVSFSYAGAGVVLPGDLESAGEQWLVDHLSGPRALLKVPHHGSSTSSSPQLLQHFSPAIAMSSSGRNHSFGHPSPQIVERYEDRDIDLFRTDRHGTVTVTIDTSGRIKVQRTR